jgi:hypothetical protein
MSKRSDVLSGCVDLEEGNAGGCRFAIPLIRTRPIEVTLYEQGDGPIDVSICTHVFIYVYYGSVSRYRWETDHCKTTIA